MNKANNNNNIVPRGKIIIYKAKDGPKLDVRLERETVWLTQAQIAFLFDTERSVVTKHLSNIFKEGELVEKSNVQKIHIPNSDKPIKFYRLDAIISVGYRVNSKQATQFRIWATKTLKEHLIKGYTINQQRLLTQADNLRELQYTIAFLRNKARHQLLEGQAREILDILDEYAKSVSILEQYDANKLALIKEKKSVFVLTYEDCLKTISRIKVALVAKKQAGAIFGQETGKKFESIIQNLYQTFGGKELYASLEEKSAHLLYLTIKDHPFVDGK